MRLGWGYMSSLSSARMYFSTLQGKCAAYLQNGFAIREKVAGWNPGLPLQPVWCSFWVWLLPPLARNEVSGPLHVPPLERIPSEWMDADVTN